MRCKGKRIYQYFQIKNSSYICPMSVPFSASRIVYEDNHILIANKLPSEIVQGDKTGDEPLPELIKTFIKQRDNKPGNVFCGVVHRIDRPVSGLVIFAKTSKGLSRFSELFRDKGIQKQYLAVVKNKPKKEKDHLVHFLVKNEKNNTVKVFDKEVKNAQRSELKYEILISGDNYHLLKIELITGRHHQIRAQLAAIGSPIKGDLKYGFDRSNKGGGIHLHSFEMQFMHPIKQETIHVKIWPGFEDNLWQFFKSKLYHL
jgi:23S rRNA pseudouridine1911/1915/1917 synthase